MVHYRAEDMCLCAHAWSLHEDGMCDNWPCKCRKFRLKRFRPPKATTAWFRSALVNPLPKHLMCWEAALTHFGVPFTPLGKGLPAYLINDHLKKAGFTVTKVDSKDIVPGIDHHTRLTLAIFFGTKPEGDWLVYTPGHVISVRDGLVTDTVGNTATVCRRVCAAYKVTMESA